MREICCLSQIILETISDLRRIAGYIYTFVLALISSRVTLAAWVLAAESQLAECKRRIKKKDQPRPRFALACKLLWVFLSRVWDPWPQVARLMQPATVKRWHTTAFRLYWRSVGSAERIPYGVPNESGILCDFSAAIRRAATAVIVTEQVSGLATERCGFPKLLNDPLHGRMIRRDESLFCGHGRR